VSRYQQVIDKFLRLYKSHQGPGWETLENLRDDPEPTVFHVLNGEGQHLILVTTLEQIEELMEGHLEKTDFAVQTAYYLDWDEWESASIALLFAQVEDALEAIPAEEDVPTFTRKPVPRYPTGRRVYRKETRDDREPFS
jgi:hypothetical protein